MIENIVNVINSVFGSAKCVFSSFITLNYYVGDFVATIISYVYNFLASALSTLFLVVSILLEDLVVFLKELTESVGCGIYLLFSVLQGCWDGIYNSLMLLTNNILNTLDSIINSLNIIFNSVIFTAHKCGEFFRLIGHSLILLVNLFPRMIYLLVLGFFNLLQMVKDSTLSSIQHVCQRLSNMSVEMIIGVISSVVISFICIKYSVKFIRERNITWSSILHSIIWLVCSLYIGIFESIVRCLRLTVTLMEMTVSNLRVPMFAHAGDSEDDEEDRENLVGEVEDSDDDENERIETRRRNYLLLLERAKNRKGTVSTRGSNSSRQQAANLDDDLLREVEREREDRLCCICQDHEKCIMMLPCRHLCICERCQQLLKSHGNSCPMCRKPVKQMIKAYL